MDLLEIAYTIEGSKEKDYNELYYLRYMTWLQMKPHTKEGSLKTAEELFLLPTDKKAQKTTRADVEKMEELWKEADKINWAEGKRIALN